MPQATLRMTCPDGTVIEATGELEILQSAATEVRATLITWLDTLDPEQIERDAMNSQGWGDESLAAGIIRTLRELATSIV